MLFHGLLGLKVYTFFEKRMSNVLLGGFLADWEGGGHNLPFSFFPAETHSPHKKLLKPKTLGFGQKLLGLVRQRKQAPPPRLRHNTRASLTSRPAYVISPIQGQGGCWWGGWSEDFLEVMLTLTPPGPRLKPRRPPSSVAGSLETDPRGFCRVRAFEGARLWPGLVPQFPHGTAPHNQTGWHAPFCAQRRL